ncbi:MAG: hypothetical protein CMJ64_19335 [Planctomycetaceae bacterium]|nr:hypothetical protein [Planctomycetaceae bacterium]
MPLNFLVLVATLAVATSAVAQQKVDPPFPPQLPDGKQIVTDRSDEFLTARDTLKDDVLIAKTRLRSTSCTTPNRTIRASRGRIGATRSR